MNSLAHSPQNDKRLPDLMNEVREFGRLEAQGKDALPMLAIKVAQAAEAGVITLDKDAEGVDDFARVYTEYTKARGKKAVHEHTAGGLKANISKLRQIGTAATMPTCDFITTINNLVEKRDEMVQVKDGPKVKPCYAAIVDAARTQITQADDLTADQIVEAIRKPEAADKTLEGTLKNVVKTLTDVTKGEHGQPQDNSVEVVQALALIETKLAALMLTKDLAETIAKANALGLTVVQPAEVTSEVAAAA